MSWQKISGGTYRKFENVGETLVGKWLGTAESRYGAAGRILQKDGQLFWFTLGAVLKDLISVELGSGVKIVYTGMAKSQSGEYKQFDVYLWVPEKKDAPS